MKEYFCDVVQAPEPVVVKDSACSFSSAPTLCEEIKCEVETGTHENDNENEHKNSNNGIDTENQKIRPKSRLGRFLQICCSWYSILFVIGLILFLTIGLPMALPEKKNHSNSNKSSGGDLLAALHRLINYCNRNGEK